MIFSYDKNLIIWYVNKNKSKSLWWILSNRWSINSVLLLVFTLLPGNIIMFYLVIFTHDFVILFNYFRLMIHNYCRLYGLHFGWRSFYIYWTLSAQESNLWLVLFYLFEGMASFICLRNFYNIVRWKFQFDEIKFSKPTFLYSKP